MRWSPFIASIRLSGDVNWVWVGGGVGLKAAPSPVAGFGDQTPCDGVSVNITELFDALSFREDVEIVVSGLPDVLFCSSAGKALFEDLNGKG